MTVITFNHFVKILPPAEKNITFEFRPISNCHMQREKRKWCNGGESEDGGNGERRREYMKIQKYIIT